MQSFDLSRFSACTVKTPKIVDLMRLPEFRARLDAYTGVVDDQWLYQTACKVEKQLRLSKDSAARILRDYGESSLAGRQEKYRLCHNAVKYMRRTLSICAENDF